MTTTEPYAIALTDGTTLIVDAEVYGDFRVYMLHGLGTLGHTGGFRIANGSLETLRNIAATLAKGAPTLSAEALAWRKAHVSERSLEDIEPSGAAIESCHWLGLVYEVVAQMVPMYGYDDQFRYRAIARKATAFAADLEAKRRKANQ